MIITINRYHLMSMIKKTYPIIKVSDKIRRGATIEVVHFQLDFPSKRLSAVGTDGHIMSRVWSDVKTRARKNHSFNIRKKEVDVLKHLIRGMDSETVDLDVQMATVHVSGPKHVGYVAINKERYPRWQYVMPNPEDRRDRRAKVKRLDFSRAIKVPTETVDIILEPALLAAVSESSYNPVTCIERVALETSRQRFSTSLLRKSVGLFSDKEIEVFPGDGTTTMLITENRHYHIISPLWI